MNTRMKMKRTMGSGRWEPCYCRLSWFL